MKLRVMIAALAVTAGLAAGSHAHAATVVDVHYNDWDMPVTGHLIDGTT